MIRKLSVIVILGILAGSIYSQAVLPVSKDNILIFIEPFEDSGPDKSQGWLNQGLPGFIKSSLTESDHVHVYPIPDFQSNLVDRPHKLQNMIWKSVFQKQVDPAYETYLILGSYSYLENEITIRMDLLSLTNTRVLAHFEKNLPYTKLLSWKSEMGEWVLSQLRLIENQMSPQALPKIPDSITPVPGISIREQLTTLFNTRDQNESEDLHSRYKKQSRLKLGSQLESLWHDIAFDPYLANIRNIQTLRLQHEPDSIQVDFTVSYRINPRILDEIQHFSATRSGLVVKTESFEEHLFMDLGYIDAAFTKEVASGDWRIVPIVTMGPNRYAHQRTFYHSFPRPIASPGEYFYNQGEFKQLLLAVPGVDAMRIFAQEVQQEYEYSIVVGRNEMKQLDKIQVKLVAEHDLSAELK